VLGDSGTSTVTLNATNGSRLKLQGDATGAAILNSGQSSTGILAQGTINSTGTIELVGSSGTTNGLNLNAAVNHSGGTLTLSGTSSPNGIANGFTADGVVIQRAVTISDSSDLTITGSYVGRGTVSTITTLSGVNIGASVTGNDGALNITGTSSLPSAIATNARGVGISGALTGWENTTITGQAAGSSIGQSILLTNNVNIGANKLQLLANGGQIHQTIASTITAGALVIDNTGAGRTSLFTDSSVSPNLTSGTAYGGSIAADGAITVGSGTSHTNSGIDLRGTTNASSNVNIAGHTRTTTTGTFGGVVSGGSVRGKNITMTASATGTTGHVLGYYGASGHFIASETLTLTGTSTSGSGNGMYSFSGSFSAGTGMSLSGTSTNGQGVGFDTGTVITNGNSGSLVISGTASTAGQVVAKYRKGLAAADKL
jgi:hypothetical protein